MIIKIIFTALCLVMPAASAATLYFEYHAEPLDVRDSLGNPVTIRPPVQNGFLVYDSNTTNPSLSDLTDFSLDVPYLSSDRFGNPTIRIVNFELVHIRIFELKELNEGVAGFELAADRYTQLYDNALRWSEVRLTVTHDYSATLEGANTHTNPEVSRGSVFIFVVPEMSSSGLLCLGGMAFLRRRCR